MEIEDQRIEILNNINFISPYIELPKKLTVRQNLEVYGRLYDVKNLKKQIDSISEELRLYEIIDKITGELSSGQKNRVSLAKSIINNPSVLLLDEPFAGVDPISVNDIKNVIYQLKQKNIGILITDHNVRETLDICERAYIIGEGKVIAEGTSKQILHNKRVQEVYLGDNFRI